MRIALAGLVATAAVAWPAGLLAEDGAVPPAERILVRPVMDVPLRDPSVCRGPDGAYYLTGTTPKERKDGTLDWHNGTAIRLWTSKDLATWREVGVVWDLAKVGWAGRWATGPRALAGVPDSPRHYLAVTSPEIHYLRDTFQIPYSVNGQGTGLLRSKTGEARGPYEDWGKGSGGLTYITADGADPSMFQDDDGSVYWLWSPAWIAKMTDDLRGLALLTCQPRQERGSDMLVGERGPFLFKADGKYHLTAAAMMRRIGIHTHDTLVATASKLHGPYPKREMMIPHGGPTTVFRNAEGG